MRVYLLLGAAALSLGACKLDRTPSLAQTAQLTSGPFQMGLAPSYNALPYAPPAPVTYAPQPVAYDYWNDAYSANQAYYNVPPSYYDYGGATPLVWTQPGSNTGTSLVTRIVEALIGGGQREYYYQPGASSPYFVRDPQYAYAFDDGNLAMVYDPYGQPLSQQIVLQQAPYAGRYLLRADTLRNAAISTALNRLAPDVWTTQRTVLMRDLDRKDGWKATWAPGANRSPVAIRRLAEVRARKELRDEAHDAWKAQERKDRVVRKADQANDHGRAATARVRENAHPNDKGRPHAEIRPAQPQAKAHGKDRAEVSRGPAMTLHARVDHGPAAKVEAKAGHGAKAAGSHQASADEGKGKGGGKKHG